MTDNDSKEDDLIGVVHKLADLVAAQIDLQRHQIELQSRSYAASAQAAEGESARMAGYFALVQPLVPMILERLGVSLPAPPKPQHRHNGHAPNGHVIPFPTSASPPQPSSSPNGVGVDGGPLDFGVPPFAVPPPEPGPQS